MKTLRNNYNAMVSMLEENLAEMMAEQKSGYDESIYDEPTTERIENMKVFIAQMKAYDVTRELLRNTVDIAMVTMAAGFQNEKSINGVSLIDYVANRLAKGY